MNYQDPSTTEDRRGQDFSELSEGPCDDLPGSEDTMAGYVQYNRRYYSAPVIYPEVPQS